MKVEFKIERLKVKDFEKFYLFVRDFLLNQYLDYPPRVRKLYLKQWLNPKDLKNALKEGRKEVLLALSEGETVGFLILDFGLPGGSAMLDWLGVDRKFRERGIGTSLLREGERQALSHKCHFIWLYTESKEDIKFYKKRGYYLVGLQQEAWYGMDEYLMQKNLRKPFKEIFKL